MKQIWNNRELQGGCRSAGCKQKKKRKCSFVSNVSPHWVISAVCVKKIWKCLLCFFALTASEWLQRRTFVVKQTLPVGKVLDSTQYRNYQVCAYLSLYFMQVRVSECTECLFYKQRTRTAVNVSDQHVYVTFDFSVFHNLPLSPQALLRSLPCVCPQSCLFMRVEAAEERRRLCKCLRDRSFWVRMWSRVINT